MSRNKLLVIILVVTILGSAGLVAAIVIGAQSSAKKTETGLLAVKYLYNFSGLGELDSNKNKLKEITTEEVYNQLTLDNTDRALNVYLKFKNKPTKVVPDQFSEDYIIYSLETESIESYRKFAFFYHVNSDGKIDQVRESEVVDFVGTP